MKPTQNLYALAIALTLIACTLCDAQTQGQIDTMKSERIAAQLTDEDGNVVSGNLYVSGKKSGLWQTCHSNGQLKTEGTYISGQKEGKHKEWSDTGILLEEKIFKNGKGNGLTQWFHEGGHLAAEGQMVDNIRQGPWKICDIEENGFCIDANFVDGKREGIWKIYHDKTQASVWKEQTFENDRMVSERCFDLAGVVTECD